MTDCGLHRDNYVMYETSGELADILGPLVGLTQHHVKNSKELA